MTSGSVGVRRRPGSVGDLVLGSWPRTLAAGVLIALVVVVGVWAYASGSLANLRYASFPGHPYPPAGYYQNPFNARDRGDLINAADAGRVKADLLRDGGIELQAVASGDASLLTQSTTGNALVQLRSLIAQNNANGVVEKEEVKLDSVVVGRLADPNDPTVRWCVEEKGTGTITTVSKATGQTLATQSLRFDNKFWMASGADRYLITDVLVSTQPVPAA